MMNRVTMTAVACMLERGGNKIIGEIPCKGSLLGIIHMISN